MKTIPAATTVVLTPEERQVLEALAGSRKAEARMRDRARIVLLASAGMASRAIAREIGCTPGTASKWRVRYASDRLAGLSETGDRGNDPTYGPEHRQRILALLDKPPPAGIAIGRPRCWRANWGRSMSSISGGSCAPRRSTCPAANPGAKARTRLCAEGC